MTTIYQQLKSARIASGLSQSEFAEKLGLPQSYISRIEGEKSDIRLSSLQEWSRLLGLEVMLVPKQLQPMIHQMLKGNDISRSLPDSLLEDDE